MCVIGSITASPSIPPVPPFAPYSLLLLHINLS
jgi:hypothetical protein